VDPTDVTTVVTTVVVAVPVSVVRILSVASMVEISVKVVPENEVVLSVTVSEMVVA
jgi:hypothetical protein